MQRCRWTWTSSLGRRRASIYLRGEGMFVVEGKSVTLMDQAGAAIRTDKKQFLKQSPVANPDRSK